jgi:microcystin-dependent protein
VSEPFLGQLMIASFNFAPKGWALANGQLLPINQNQALFALLGTFYGGNGIQTFGLPSLQGRVPIHQGNGFTIGQSGGEETHTIIASEMAAHQHAVTTQASKDEETTNRPDGAYFTKGGAYGTAADTALAATTTAATGGSQAHENRMPSLALTFVIALQGIFPSQS